MTPLDALFNVVAPPNLPVLAASTAVFALVAWVLYTRCLHPLASIPGPFLASVTRLWYVIEVRKGQWDITHRALHARYGPIIRISPNEVTTTHPSAIQTIYGVKSQLTKTDWYRIWRLPNPDTTHADTFTDMDKEHHASRRRLLNSMYSMTSVLESESVIDGCSQLLMQKLGQLAEQGSVDLGKWLQFYAFDVIGELYFGSKFGFMEAEEDVHGWIQMLDDSIAVLMNVANLPAFWRMPYGIVYGAIAWMRKAQRDGLAGFAGLAAWANEHVNSRLGDLAEDAVTGRKDMLAKLIKLRDSKGDMEQFNTADVQLEGYVGMLAGSDTTATAMRAIVHQLLTHPGALQRVRSELESAVAKGELSLPVKFAEAQQSLPFFSACVKEATRLHPSVGMTMPRLVPTGGCEIAGHYFPEGTTVGINAAALHYEDSIFGSDAAEFKPDRWLDSQASTIDKYLLTFGGGTRTCMGKNISLAEIHKMLPMLFMTFDMELTHERPYQSRAFWFNKQVSTDEWKQSLRPDLAVKNCAARRES